MKNQSESMPKPSQEPKPPQVQDEDVESLMKAFEEADKEKRAAEAPVEEADPEFQALLEESEKSMEADIQASKAERLKKLLASIPAKSFMERAALIGAEETLDAHLDEAMSAPDSAMLLLTNPLDQRLRAVADPQGGFGKKHDNEKVRQAFALHAGAIRHAAVEAVKAGIARRLEDAEDPEDISNLHKVLEAIEHDTEKG